MSRQLACTFALGVLMTISPLSHADDPAGEKRNAVEVTKPKDAAGDGNGGMTRAQGGLVDPCKKNAQVCESKSKSKLKSKPKSYKADSDAKS
jgi:hypothetical protein